MVNVELELRPLSEATKLPLAADSKVVECILERRFHEASGREGGAVGSTGLEPVFFDSLRSIFLLMISSFEF